jgi:hypothetical protein
VTNGSKQLYVGFIGLKNLQARPSVPFAPNVILRALDSQLTDVQGGCCHHTEHAADEANWMIGGEER